MADRHEFPQVIASRTAVAREIANAKPSAAFYFKPWPDAAERCKNLPATASVRKKRLEALERALRLQEASEALRAGVYA